MSEVAARDATIAGARDFLAALFGLFWRYRFLYRDINELLSRNRRLETRFKRIVERETALMHIWLQDLARNGDLLAPADRLEALATNMIVVSSFWLSFEFVRDARSFGSGRHIAASTQRGMRQTLALLDPWLAEPARAELAHTLADLPADTAGRPRAPDWQDIRQPQPGVAWSPPLAVRTTALRAARATASDSSHITDAAAPRAADADAATADAAETTAGTQPPTPTDGQ
ncbi:TetR/AcrR family transcriptional regulator [Derxia gummosa]|uniref:TetR/AcrR family transcriptional regulator n=1 Tax=Derxia gummosa DSM 723 TaxID=1121388 RepID=A0AC36KLL4_9BURK